MESLRAHKKHSDVSLTWFLWKIKYNHNIVKEKSPHLPMVVMIVPQKKAAEDMSQWLVKFSRRLPTSRPASTADTTLCRERGPSFKCTFTL